MTSAHLQEVAKPPTAIQQWKKKSYFFVNDFEEYQKSLLISSFYHRAEEKNLTKFELFHVTGNKCPDWQVVCQVFDAISNGQVINNPWEQQLLKEIKEEPEL